jgi:uncharacterized protein YjbI with pentapeptide repeats
MIRIVGVFFVTMVFGCSAIGGKEFLPKTSAFPYKCRGPYVDRKPSDEIVSKVRIVHETWLKDSKNPEGQKANLCGANLSYGKLQKADLKFAVFQMAMLAGANFTSAKLNKAQLQGANLSGANFSNAQLTGANLENTMLHFAIFRKTKFGKETSLRNAMLFKAKFKEVDLTEVEGLTQSQINMACLDLYTKLPQGVSRPKPCS